MVAAPPDPVTKFAPVTLTGVIPAAPDPAPDATDKDRAQEDGTLALDAATRALIAAMRHHGIGNRDERGLEWRAGKIVAAACETAPSQCVVLVKGSEADARRLATAGVREFFPTGTVQPVDVTEAARLIARMVTDRG
jgi:hypothetical protein